MLNTLDPAGLRSEGTASLRRAINPSTAYPSYVINWLTQRLLPSPRRPRIQQENQSSRTRSPASRRIPTTAFSLRRANSVRTHRPAYLPNTNRVAECSASELKRLGKEAGQFPSRRGRIEVLASLSVPWSVGLTSLLSSPHFTLLYPCSRLTAVDLVLRYHVLTPTLVQRQEPIHDGAERRLARNCFCPN